jgi:hypothetical protein
MNYVRRAALPKWKSRWSRGHTIGRTCRVCGLRFRSRRIDAITCSSTCRQRLKRGQAFAYLEGEDRRLQKAERKRHEALDEQIAAHRDRMRLVRARRAEKRAKKQALVFERAQTGVISNAQDGALSIRWGLGNA